MCAVRWDMVKTIGDEDTVEDIESDSDVEVEVVLKCIYKIFDIYINSCFFSINQKNIKPKVILILMKNLSF